MDLDRLLLLVAARYQIEAEDVVAAVARLEALTGVALEALAFRAAVNRAVSAGDIHEPVRLPDGALQCHWRLELTLRGRAVAMDLVRGSGESVDELIERLGRAG